jgi:hypothetical protein
MSQAYVLSVAGYAGGMALSCTGELAAALLALAVALAAAAAIFLHERRSAL